MYRIRFNMIRNMVAKYLVLVFLLHGAFGFPTTNHTCVHDKFNCQDGTCIPINWRCDGEFDCKSKLDEQDCDNTTTCSGGSFQCSNGACVPHRWRCDGESDCQDGSDEKNCETTALTSTTQSTMPSSSTTKKSSTSPMMTSTSQASIATVVTSRPSLEVKGPDPSCQDGQQNCLVLVADTDICSMPASAQLLCASTCRMCSGSSGSQHVTNGQSMQTDPVNPGYPTAAPTSATEATTTEGSTHAPYTAPPTDETVESGCVDVEKNCDHLVKTVNICNDGVKARFLCRRTCNVCDAVQVIG